MPTILLILIEKLQIIFCGLAADWSRRHWLACSEYFLWNGDLLIYFAKKPCKFILNLPSLCVAKWSKIMPFGFFKKSSILHASLTAKTFFASLIEYHVMRTIDFFCYLHFGNFHLTFDSTATSSNELLYGLWVTYFYYPTCSFITFTPFVIYSTCIYKATQLSLPSYRSHAFCVPPSSFRVHFTSRH